MTLKDKATGEVKLVKAVRPSPFLRVFTSSMSGFPPQPYQHAPLIAFRRIARVPPVHLSFRVPYSAFTRCVTGLTDIFAPIIL